LNLSQHRHFVSTKNALSHLKEQADFMRNLGSYPQRSRLVGPVAKSVEEMKHSVVDPSEVSLSSLPSDVETEKPLNIGIMGGFDDFGQNIAQKLAKRHKVSCLDNGDKVSIIYQFTGSSLLINLPLE
jgi:hypothetical protein